MKTLKESNTVLSPYNLGIIDREVRVLMGASMIAAVMLFAPSPIGEWSLLALVAIPLLMTGMVGFDPLYTLLGLNSDRQHDEEIQQRNWAYSNVGLFDRIIRFALGVVLIGLTLSGALIGWEMVGTLAIIPLIITAIIAWDPLYALTKINTFASRQDVEMANAELNEETVAKLYDFPTSDTNEVTHRHGKAA